VYTSLILHQIIIKDPLEKSTPFFQKLKQRIAKEDKQKKNEKGHRERPKFPNPITPQCSKCKSKSFDKKKFNPSWAKYENSDGSPNYQLNNPYIEHTCKNCKTPFKVSMPMPYPLPKKYKTSPKLT